MKKRKKVSPSPKLSLFFLFLRVLFLIVSSFPSLSVFLSTSLCECHTRKLILYSVHPQKTHTFRLSFSLTLSFPLSLSNSHSLSLTHVFTLFPFFYLSITVSISFSLPPSLSRLLTPFHSLSLSLPLFRFLSSCLSLPPTQCLLILPWPPHSGLPRGPRRRQLLHLQHGLERSPGRRLVDVYEGRLSSPRQVHSRGHVGPPVGQPAGPRSTGAVHADQIW